MTKNISSDFTKYVDGDFAEQIETDCGFVALTVRSAQLTTVTCNVAFEVCCWRIISTSNDGELNAMVIDCDNCLVNNGMWMKE